MNHTAYIGIGSNLGDQVHNIRDAVRLLEDHPLIRVLAISHFYETEPMTLNGEKQNWYTNCAIKIKTTLNPIRLFHVMQDIETLMGREHSGQRWSPRCIDLDLLFFDDEIIRTKHLVIPHPGLHLRRFVLKPLSEIAPNLKHPIKGVAVKNLLRDLDDNKKVIPIYKLSLTQSSEGVLKTPLHERL